MKKEKINYSHLTKPEDLTDKPKKQPLDPNHSHFILVDNARIGFGGEIDFRADLESAISKSNSNNSKIPIVVLVLEGGVGTIKTVFESINNQSPCVFIDVKHKFINYSINTAF